MYLPPSRPFPQFSYFLLTLLLTPGLGFLPQPALLSVSEHRAWLPAAARLSLVGLSLS